jgi:hypothetical protein
MSGFSNIESVRSLVDVEIGRADSRAELDAECRAVLGRRNDDDGSLNLKHRNLLKEQHGSDRPDGFRVRAESCLSKEADQVFMWSLR